MRRAWPICLAMLGGCAALRSLLQEPPPASIPAHAVKVRGPQARAIGVAFSDFAAQLAAFRAEAEADLLDAGTSPGDLAKRKAEWQCTDRPETYDAWVWLDDGGTRYTVEVIPNWEVCYGKDAEVFGGGATYQIDATSFGILEREMQE